MANQRALIELEITKNDRKYVLILPMGSPLGEVYDVCHEFLREILDMSRIAADNAAQKNEQPSIEPEVVKDNNG